MPVEAALGDAQALGQDFHAQAVRAVLGEDGDRGLDPCVAIEHGADWFAGLLFHAGEYRTFHTDAYVLFDSFCR
jgi:hypothetical protein